MNENLIFFIPSTLSHGSRSGLLVIVVQLLAATFVLGAFGCSKESATTSTGQATQPQGIGPDECGACGMVVREQPAPRGQLIHRDGTRRFFCSIGDLVHYLESPSPHGEAEHIYVEVLTRDEHPDIHDNKPHPWRPASAAEYVLGVKRTGIMGPPILVFSSRDEATEASVKFNATYYSWPALRGAVLSTADQPQAQQ